MATENAPLQPFDAESAAQHLLNTESLLGEQFEPEKETQANAETEEVAPHESESEPVKEAQEHEESDAEDTEIESTEDNSDEGVDLTLENLARHYGVETDDLYNLELPTKVNGQEGKASLRELVKNYQLESVITQKSMKLSDELKATEQEREQVKQQRDAYQQQLAPFLQHLNQLVQDDNQIDWASLADNNPQEYMRQKAQADERAKARNIAEEQYQFIQQQKLSEHVQREGERLQELIPEWADAEVKKVEAPELTNYMKSMGYSEDDIQSINFGKAEWIQTIRKAWLFDKTSSNVDTKKKVASAPKLKLKGGARRSPNDDKADARKQKMGKLKSSGRIEDAQSLINDLLS